MLKNKLLWRREKACERKVSDGRKVVWWWWWWLGNAGKVVKVTSNAGMLVWMVGRGRDRQGQAQNQNMTTRLLCCTLRLCRSDLRGAKESFFPNGIALRIADRG